MIYQNDILDEKKAKILREKSDEVTFPMNEDDILNLNSMIMYLRVTQDEEYAQRKNLRAGMGLAAIQLGIKKRYFVISYKNDDGTFEEYKVINPKIISNSEELIYVEEGEGCLSVNRYVEGIVPRYARITVEYYDEFGNKISFIEIAKQDTEKVKTYFMVDMAHIAGLVATGLHQSPIPYADVITSTTHKTLRGPRGGIILTNNEEMIKKINKAVFPGTQGGPLENIIAAKAVCFGEALKPEFKEYMKKVVDNCKALANSLINYNFNVLTSGTDNHLILLDLRNKGITGKELEARLEEVGIIVNKNAVPFDTENKATTSGIRIGTAAVTSRGLGLEEMRIIASIIDECCHSDTFEEMKEQLKLTVKQICNKFPLYKEV